MLSGSIVDSYNTLNCKYANNPRKSNRQKLLNTHITKIIIVVDRIVPKVLRPLTDTLSFCLPAVASTAGLSHVSIWVPKGDFFSYKGVLIEYGGYDERREGDYKEQVHYYKGTDGLRFMKMPVIMMKLMFTTKKMKFGVTFYIQ